MTEYYDLIVIGSGPAGEKGAAKAAYFGKRVALIERASQLGGAGINTGTLPSKTLRETALYFSGLRQRGLYGIDYSLKEGLSVGDFMHRERVVVENERRQIERNLNRHNIDVIYGEASFKAAHCVQVRKPKGESIELQGEIILVATGSSPFRPPTFLFDDRLIYDSDTILRMDRLPKTMAVVGGGVIGCEYASLFAALGVQVTLIDAHARLLPFVDSEIVERLRLQLELLGLCLMLNERVMKTETAHNRVDFALASGEHVECDIALIAAGRKSNVEGLGLEAVGVKTGERGVILVNENYQTSVSNIYAAGDVIGAPMLAATSMEQARLAMVCAFNLQYADPISPVVPMAVYTVPEIAMVGLTEDECTAKKIPYLVGRSAYEKSPRGQIIGDTSGMLKLIFSPHDKKLLGAHMIGELASELIHIGAYALEKADTLDHFLEAVYNYPTLTDSYKYAAYDGLGHWEQKQKIEKILEAGSPAQQT